jgi:hypothetical protein
VTGIAACAIGMYRPSMQAAPAAKSTGAVAAGALLSRIGVARDVIAILHDVGSFDTYFRIRAIGDQFCSALLHVESALIRGYRHINFRVAEPDGPARNDWCTGD